MFKWKSFNEYKNWRLNEEQVHNMSHDEALKWVLSALGIMDNADLHDADQRNEINDALSSPLSSYPQKLDSLATQLQLQNSTNWPQIQAALADPQKTTVSKFVSLLSANTAPQRTVSDRAAPEDDEQVGQTYREPDGKSPL